jgi:hypothetical protein
MTDTITSSEPPTALDTGGTLPRDPSDILITLIVAFLAPMFLSATGGDIAYARMAAIETVNAYRVRNPSDLLGIAQIIGFGLAALGSLSLSMADDISVALVLRLRGNATSLSRAAEQHRRALVAARSEEAAADAQAADASPNEVTEVEVATAVARAQRAAGEAANRIRAQQQAERAPLVSPAPVVAPEPAAAKAGERLTDAQRRTMWAAAMADVAAESAAEIPNLPPAERQMALLRTTQLANSANALLTGSGEPAFNPLVRTSERRPNPGASR